MLTGPTEHQERIWTLQRYLAARRDAGGRIVWSAPLVRRINEARRRHLAKHIAEALGITSVGLRKGLSRSAHADPPEQRAYTLRGDEAEERDALCLRSYGEHVDGATWPEIARRHWGGSKHAARARQAVYRWRKRAGMHVFAHGEVGGRRPNPMRARREP